MRARLLIAASPFVRLRLPTGETPRRRRYWARIPVTSAPEDGLRYGDALAYAGENHLPKWLERCTEVSAQHGGLDNPGCHKSDDGFLVQALRLSFSQKVEDFLAGNDVQRRRRDRQEGYVRDESGHQANIRQPRRAVEEDPVSFFLHTVHHGQTRTAQRVSEDVTVFL